MCLFLGNRYSSSRGLSLSPLSWFSVGPLPFGEARVELGVMVAAGTNSKGSSVSFDQESPKLYIMQAASHKPLWSGLWVSSGFLGLHVFYCPVQGVQGALLQPLRHSQLGIRLRHSSWELAVCLPFDFSITNSSGLIMRSSGGTPTPQSAFCEGQFLPS